MTISDYIGIVGIVLGLIGIIVGILGWKSLATAIKIKNHAKDISNSTIQQAQTITVNNTNGLDSYAVIKLSTATTKEQLEKIILQINENENKLTSVIEQIEKTPQIHIEKDGKIWVKVPD